jgi:hypothetical protein
MIESIVGRFPHLVDPTGRTMQYLVKWEDVSLCISGWKLQLNLVLWQYGMAAATWTPEPEIGHSAPVLIQKFEDAAAKEGLSLSNRQAFVLLKEAADAGWGFNQSPLT